MEKSEVMSIVNNYVSEVIKVFKPNKIYLYGSYAKGSARYESDIDIALVFDEYEGDYLEGLKSLYKIRRDIDNRIEPVILEEKNDPSGFLKDIKKNGVEIK